jgi:hypothetical protein
MINFFLKSFVVIIVLFFGVLLGMQQANVGLLQMKGYDDPSLGGAFQLNKSDTGEIEASVLGEQITALGIEEKKQKLEEFKAFNFFSMIGSKIGETLSSTFQALIQFTLSSIDKLLTYLASL